MAETANSSQDTFQTVDPGSEHIPVAVKVKRFCLQEWNFETFVQPCIVMSLDSYNEAEHI